jgi:hypothetical protein
MRPIPDSMRVGDHERQKCLEKRICGPFLRLETPPAKTTHQSIDIERLAYYRSHMNPLLVPLLDQSVYNSAAPSGVSSLSNSWESNYGLAVVVVFV